MFLNIFICLLLNFCSYLCSTDRTRLNADNYSEMLKLMIHVQDLNVQSDLSRYSAQNALILPTDKPYTYCIETTCFDDLPTNLSEGDFIKLTVCNSPEDFTDVEGVISQVFSDALVIKLEKKIEANSIAKVKFVSNRTTCRLELQALEFLRKHELSTYFFPDKPPKPTKNQVLM